MVAKLFAVLSFAFLAAASQCNTGSIQCCNSAVSYKDATPTLEQYSLVGVAADVKALVGLSCSGVSVVGTSNGCEASQKALCCQKNYYNGAVSLGCSPIDVGV